MMRKRWKMKKLPLALTMMLMHMLLGMTSTSLSGPTPAEAAAAVTPSMMMTIKDPAELSLMAGLYNPTSFQASPSCAYTFATLKIQNTHKTEVVTIYGIDTIDFRMLQPSNASSSTGNEIHVTDFSNRVVRIKPESSVILPISYFPQIPSHQHMTTLGRQGQYEGKKEQEEPSQHPPPPVFSRAAAVDLANLVGMDMREFSSITTATTSSSSSSSLHQTQQTLILQTSRGNTTAVIKGTATIHNPYRLPHTIVFYGNGFVSSGQNVFTAEQGQWEYLFHLGSDASSSSRSSRHSQRSVQDIGYEYDLYMDNPSNERFQVLQVYTSRPDLFEIQPFHTQGYTTTRGGGGGSSSGTETNPQPPLLRFNNCGVSREELTYCNRAMGQDTVGPISIDPNGKRVYIGTLRLHNRTDLETIGIQGGGSSFLGYLHIRTSKGLLSTVIEFFTPMVGGNEFKDSIPPSQPRNETLVPDHKPLEIQTTPASIHENRDLQKCDPMRITRLPDSIVTADPSHGGGSDSLYQFDMQDEWKVVEASPSFIDFGLFTVAGNQRKQGISITNHGTYPIRLMRGSVAIDIAPQQGGLEEITNINGTTNRSVPENLNEYSDSTLQANLDTAQNHSVVIPVRDTAENLVFLELSSLGHLSEDNQEDPLFYRGSILLHFGPADQDYSEWKQNIINDVMAAKDYIIEVSFSVTIMHGSITYNMNDVYFPFEVDLIPSRASSKNACTESFDRVLHFKNDFPTKLHLQSINILGDDSNSHFLSDEICRRHFHIIDFEGSDKNIQFSDQSTANAGQVWGGIKVRYDFLDNEDFLLSAPRQCTLKLGIDKIGDFHVPLWVFSGLVDVKTESSAVPDACRSPALLNGIGCLKLWNDSTSIGIFIVRSFKRHYETKREARLFTKYERQNWFDEFLHYIVTMQKKNRGVKRLAYVDPISISLGTIGPNSIETRSIFVTNLNPISITLSASVPSIEGMEIRMGQIQANIMDYTDPKQGGKKTIDWLYRNLDATGLPSQNFLTSLKYRDDISLSPHASNDLKNIYRQVVTVKMRRSRLDAQSTESKKIISEYNSLEGLSLDGKSDANKTKQVIMQMHPPGFIDSSFYDDLSSTSIDNMKKPFGSVLTANNGSVSRHLSSVHPSASSQSWTIPPGGVARLEVLIRSPTRQALENMDFNKELLDFNKELFTTGVILQSNYGQIMPILVAYKALSGELSMKSSETGKTEWIDTTAIIQPKRDEGTLGIHEQLNEQLGTVVGIQSTFHSDAVLDRIESCNGWFQVQIHNSSAREDCARNVHSGPSNTGDFPICSKRDDFTGQSKASYLGLVYSTISCGHSSSFYECALDLLEDRFSVQKQNCGTYDEEVSDIADSYVEKSRSVAISKLKSAISYMKTRYNQGNGVTKSNHNLGSKRPPSDLRPLSSGTIPQETVSIFDDAITSWEDATSHGLNIFTSSVRAHFEIANKTSEVETSSQSTITTSLPLPRLRSALSRPTLYNPRETSEIVTSMEDNSSVLTFPITEVGDVSMQYIPVKNPTGFPIHIRLSTLVSKDMKRQFLDGKITSLRVAGANSAIFVQESEKTLNPWWTGGSYFIADNNGALMQSTHNVTIKAASGSSLSLLNPSLHATSAFSHGCFGRRCGYVFPKNSEQDRMKTESGQVSPIGASSANGKTLKGRHYDSDGKENAMSANIQTAKVDYPPFALGTRSLQEIVLPPFGTGTLGPVYFRPFSRNEFSSSLFLENSLTGLESIKIRGTGGWKKIAFLDIENSGILGGDLEMRNAKPTLMFSDHGGSQTLIKSIRVVNLGDTNVSVERVHLNIAYTLPHYKSKRIEVATDLEQSPCHRRGFRLLGCYEEESGDNSKEIPANIPNLLHGFSLAPNETQVLQFSHTLDCNFQFMHVSVQLDYGDPVSENDYISLHNEENELILGYEMPASDLAICSRSLYYSLKRMTSKQSCSSSLTDSTSVQVTRCKNSRQITKHNLLELFLLVIPVIIFSFVLFDIIATSNQRRASSAAFRKITVGNELNKDALKNWTGVYQCLSRTDPSANDLIQLGKEQSKQLLLGRYRKDGIIQPRCVLPNGTFTRDKYNVLVKESKSDQDGKVPTSPTGTSNNRRNSASSGITVTISDTLFSKYQHINLTTLSDQEGVDEVSLGSMIPCGLGWRGAVKRSIISSPFKETSFISSNSAEMKRLKVSLMDKKTVSKGEHNKHSMEPKLMMKHPDKPSKHVDKTKVRKPSSIEIKEAIKPKEVVRQSVNPVTSLQHKTSAKSISSVSLKKTNMLPRTEKKMVGRRQSSKPERNIVLDGPAEKGISKSNTKMCALKSETRTSEFETKVKDIVNKEESAIVLSDTSDEKSDILRAEKVQAKLDLKGESILSKEAKLKNSQNEEHKTEVSSKKDKKHDTQDQNLPGIKASDLKLIATPKEPDEIFRKDIADLPQNIEKVQSRSSEETISTSKKRTKELPDDDTVLENRDEPSLSGHSRTVAPIRPPPGLSPPPGFFSESSTSLQESENSRKPSSTLFDTSSQTASTIDQVGDVKSSCSGNETIEISGMEYYARPSSTPSERGADNDLDFALPNNDLLMSLLGDDQEPNIITGDCLFYKEEPKLSNESEQQVSSPLLGLGQDINVMDFLSFLDDGEKSDNTLSGDDNISSLRYDYGGAPSSLQSNPWRESSQTPRALAYGIEVEQEKLGYATSEIPLLTPAFVLGNAETPTHQHEDEEEADEKYLNGDPFLASLLQGDSQDEI